MDYIIIQKNGNPLTFGSVAIPNAKDDRDTIIVYGDKEDAENDFSEDEDLGIVSLTYKVNGETETTEVIFDNKKVGEFNSKFGDEADFQEKLWDFIIIYDFVTKQLPH